MANDQENFQSFTPKFRKVTLMSNFRNVVRSYSPEALAVVGRDFEGLFDQLFGAPAGSCKLNGSANGDHGKILRVPAQVWEQEDKLHVELELPGVAKDSISVTFENGEILIDAEKKAGELGEHKLHHSTRVFGSIQQKVSVGDAYDADSIEASLVDGVLHLAISKKPVVQPRKIEIK